MQGKLSVKYNIRRFISALSNVIILKTENNIAFFIYFVFFFLQITALQTHTIPPITLLCNNFLKSLLLVSEKKTHRFGTNQIDVDDDVQMLNGNESDVEVEIIDEKLDTKKAWLNTREKKSKTSDNVDPLNEDKHLLRMMTKKLKFNIEIE